MARFYQPSGTGADARPQAGYLVILRVGFEVLLTLVKPVRLPVTLTLSRLPLSARFSW